MQNESWDTILIGTSLPMLFEGLRRTGAGERILFVDRAGSMGGAWRMPSLFGLAAVEVGVHLVENRPRLNRALAEFVGGHRIDETRGNFGMLAGVRLPMKLSRVLLFALVAVKALTRGRKDMFYHASQNFFQSIRHIGTSFLYPSGGFATVLSLLGSYLSDAGAEFRFGQEVGQVQVTDQGIAAAVGGAIVHSRHIVMSSRAHAPIQGMEALMQSGEIGRTHSMTMLLDRGPLRFDGYVEFIGDSTIRRIRNVGNLVNRCCGASVPMLTAHLRQKDRVDDREATAEMVLQRLARSRLLARHATPVAVSENFFSYFTLSGSSVAQIEARYPRQVTMLRTIDLSVQSLGR